MQDHLDSKNYYAFNPAIDLRPKPQPRKTAAPAEAKPTAADTASAT